MNFLKNALLVSALCFLVQISSAQSQSHQPVKEAGVVLLNHFIPMLMEKLGLVSNKQFISLAAQEKCVYIVYYTATGVEEQTEGRNALSKVLCGFHPSESVNLDQSLSQSEISLINGMLETVIHYWPAIGQSSIAGLRGSFLVRDGLLSEGQSRWKLTVDNKPYDLLLRRSPFSFSIIKYPWMENPLYVNWSY